MLYNTSLKIGLICFPFYVYGLIFVAAADMASSDFHCLIAASIMLVRIETKEGFTSSLVNHVLPLIIVLCRQHVKAITGIPFAFFVVLSVLSKKKKKNMTQLRWIFLYIARAHDLFLAFTIRNANLSTYNIYRTLLI